MSSVFLVFLLMPSALWAADLKLAFSVDCALGRDCVIQNYVDLNPGGWQTGIYSAVYSLEREAETIVRQEAEIEVLQRARMIETFPVSGSILELSAVSRKKLGQ